jgi:hypothetical protein
LAGYLQVELELYPTAALAPLSANRYRLCRSIGSAMKVPLSTDLDDLEAVPYFLWDDPMTVAELESRLENSSLAERMRLLGKILREARDTDVWRFISPIDVMKMWPRLSLHLGRRRPFWEFLLDQWKKAGFLDD